MSRGGWRHGRRWQDRQSIAEVVQIGDKRKPVGRKASRTKQDGWNDRRRVWICVPERHWVELTAPASEVPAPKQCPECFSRELLHFGGAGEASRFRWLWLLQDRGTIEGLTHHPKFDLHVRTPTGRLVAISYYEADAAYTVVETGEYVVEDHKPEKVEAQDPMFSKWKRPHFEAQYGTPVTIVTPKGKRS